MYKSVVKCHKAWPFAACQCSFSEIISKWKIKSEITFYWASPWCVLIRLVSCIHRQIIHKNGTLNINKHCLK